MSPTLHSNPPFTKNKERLHVRATPKINGSEGGFIALIVCLVLIIVVSCGAIFYLLKYHEPTDTERAARRQRRHRNLATAHSRSQGSFSVPFLSKIFGRDGDEDQTGIPGNGSSRLNLGRGVGGSNQGWVRTGSGDEWDDDSGDDLARRSQSRPRELTEVSMNQTGPLVYTQIRPPMLSFPSSDSASSIRADHITTPARSMPNIHTQLSSPTSSRIESPVRTASPDPIPAKCQIQDISAADRDRRAPSGSSTRTFSGGTKFIEAL